MTERIEDYLAELKKALKTCDPATVQDALSDAEEYLRTELEQEMATSREAEGTVLARIIEKYGQPEEVAAAYRDVEMKLPPSGTPVRPAIEPEKPSGTIDGSSLVRTFFTVFTDPKAWGSLLYLLVSLVTGILYFTWVITGISLTAGLLALIIGVPFFVFFILSVRGIGLVEGRMVETLLGVRMPRRQRYTRQDQSWWRKLKDILSERYTWFSLVYMVLMLPLGIVYFTVFVTLFACSVYLMASPLFQLTLNVPFWVSHGVGYFVYGWIFPFLMAGGVLMAFGTMNLARLVGRVHGRFAKMMLVRP